MKRFRLFMYEIPKRKQNSHRQQRKKVKIVHLTKFFFFLLFLSL